MKRIYSHLFKKLKTNFMKATVLAAAVVLGAFFTSATAQVKPSTKSQHHRIKQGVKSGRTHVFRADKAQPIKPLLVS